MQTNNNMLQRLLGIQILKLSLQPRMAVPLDLSSDVAAHDRSLVRSQWNLVRDLVANRCWSQLFHSVLPPYHFSMVFLDDKEKLKEARNIWRKTFTAILQLENFVKQHPADPFTRALLTDISTHDWTLTREFWITGKKCDFDPMDADFRELAFVCFGGPCSTGYTLESAFNHIKDAQRHSKCGRLSVFSKYCYAALNPYLEKAGVPSPQLAISEFSRFAEDPHLHNEVMADNPFVPQNTGMVKDCPSRRDIGSYWRPAGWEANRNAAAAVGLAITQCGSNYSLVKKAWLGSFASP